MVSNQQQRASQRLSSGFRINTGADDAAGLAISEGMRAQIRGMNQASRNAQDGISLLQTADGYLDTLSEMTNRMRELAVQGSNDTYNADQRGMIAREMQLIQREQQRIMDQATFNSSNIFRVSQGNYSATSVSMTGPGSAQLGNRTMTVAGPLLGNSGGFNLQVGPDTDHRIVINVAAQVRALSSMIGQTTTGATGGLRGIVYLGTTNSGVIGHGTTYAGQPAALQNQLGLTASTAGHSAWTGAINRFNDALQAINSLRSDLGAIMNKLEFTIENLDLASENMSAAESRIRDADMGQEMMRLTQANVLQQAATAMLAQGNQAPQSVLQLLG